MLNVAVLTVHSCPLATLGEQDAGGMNVYVLALARSIIGSDLSIDIYTRDHESCTQKITRINESLRIIHLRAGQPDLDKYELLSALPNFIENLVSFAADESKIYDVIHSHYWLSGFVGNHLKRIWQVPHITSFHTLAEVKQRFMSGTIESADRASIEASIISLADGVVAFTTHEKEALVNYYGATSEQVFVIPCGVDLELFKPSEQFEARSQLDFDARPIILFVGRIEPLKGVDLLCKSVAMLKDVDSPRLIVVGGESERTEMERLDDLVQELNLNSNIEFVGPVDHSELPLYYNAADVVAIPSYYESFGLVAVEALACGTPVIASRVGGLSDIVQSDEVGYLVSCRRPESFAERLEIVVGNKYLRDSFKDAARASVMHLGWGKVASEIGALYSSFTKRP
ncbi:MAG: glycosyltransferase family 1 protein [SAR202 cluster bacterium]|nr:glycosyltransferase family 1 protein [SAR202 cluster bacterium]|tara:strand:- start:981 stop:2180 length:1200 start_codon:yes stop_codon:yes gene_type:complete